MKKPVKRACDSCIARKVRCDGVWPCETCRASARQLQCTYDKPPQKRGPKIRRSSVQKEQINGGDGINDALQLTQEPEVVRDEQHELEHHVEQMTSPLQKPLRSQVMSSVHLIGALSRIVIQYENQSYGVWPIIRADVLLQQLSQPVIEEPSAYGLTTALCAATIAQLDLDPPICHVGTQTIRIDGSYLSQECIRVREQYHYREHLDIRWVLAAFFLHVYHAKTNRRNSALMFIQEALTSARLLGLDKHNQALQVPAGIVVDNGEILFPLLWVTERGYSMHLGLTSSFSCDSPLHFVNSTAENAHVKGMIALAALFVTFSQCVNNYTSKNTLVESEQLLLASTVALEDINATRLADLVITREWMRAMIWQNALSAGYLSFDSQSASLSFTFPVVIGRDLLAALRGFSSGDLLPLGRDQLLKCYEVANTLADTLLCNPALADYSTLQFGPYDLLYGLYRKIQPFLQTDDNLNSILRKKTAETLLRAPSRLRSLNLPYATAEEEMTSPTNLISS